MIDIETVLHQISPVARVNFAPHDIPKTYLAARHIRERHLEMALGLITGIVHNDNITAGTI